VYTGLHYATRVNDDTLLNNNVVGPNFQSSTRTKKAWKCTRFFVKTKTKTKTCVFVLEAPRDQDLGLEDYITEKHGSSRHCGNIIGLKALWRHIDMLSGWRVTVLASTDLGSNPVC